MRALSQEQKLIVSHIKIKHPELSSSVLEQLLNTTFNSLSGRYEVRDSSLTKIIQERDEKSFNRAMSAFLVGVNKDVGNNKKVQLKATDLITDSRLFITYGAESYERQNYQKFIYSGTGNWTHNKWTRPDLGKEYNHDHVFFDLIDHIFSDRVDSNGVLLKEHFFDWASYLLCSEGSGPNWHWMLESSVKGNGKTSIAILLGDILGKNNTVDADGALLSGDFYTGSFKNKELVILDELGTKMDKSTKRSILDSLKSLAANETFSSVSKGSQAVDVERTFGMFATTNDVTDLFLEQGDRRWLIHGTNVKPKDNTFYTKFNSDRKDSSKLNHFKKFLSDRFMSNKESIISKCKGQAPSTYSKEVLTIRSKSTAEVSVETAIESHSFGSEFGYNYKETTGIEPIFSLASVSVDGFRDGRETSIPDTIRKIMKVVGKMGYEIIEIDNGNPNESFFSLKISRRCYFAVKTDFMCRVANNINSDKGSNMTMDEWKKKLKSAVKDRIRATYLDMYLSHTGGIKDATYDKLVKIVSGGTSGVVVKKPETTVTTSEMSLSLLEEENRKLKEEIAMLRAGKAIEPQKQRKETPKTINTTTTATSLSIPKPIERSTTTKNDYSRHYDSSIPPPEYYGEPVSGFIFDTTWSYETKFDNTSRTDKSIL